MPEDLTLANDANAPTDLVEASGNVTTQNHQRIAKRLGGFVQLSGNKAVALDADGKMKASVASDTDLDRIAGLVTELGKVTGTKQTYGNLANTACEGNDARLSDARTPLAHIHAITDVTNLQSTLDGKQALDTDLTDIAGITPTNDDIIQRKAGSWINRTMAQLKTDLAIAIADVSGLVAALAGKSDVGHAHAAADVTSGQFVMARLASGTPDGTKFIRDDGVLATPAGGGSGTDLAESKRIITANYTIPANKSAYVTGEFEIADTVMLEIADGGMLEIG